MLLIAALWGGGLGLLLPGAKILLAPEGLHGWAWNSINEDRLGIRLVQRLAPPTKTADGTPIAFIIDVVEVDKKGAAVTAGIAPNTWIVGKYASGNEGGKPDIIRGDAFSSQLARMSDGQAIDLAIYDPATGAISRKPVVLGKAKLTSRGLGMVAMSVDEPADHRGRESMFLGLLALVLVLTLLRCLFTFIQEYLVGTAIWRGIMDLRCDNYDHVLRLPVTFFSEKGVSDATSRFIQDTSELARGQNLLLGKTMVEPAKALGVLTMAICLDWQLTLIAMVAGPPVFIVIRLLGKRMHRLSRRALESWSEMLAVLSETLIGIRVVKSYTMEGQERKRFFGVNRQLLRQQNKMELIDAATAPSVECLGLIAALVAAGLAGHMVFNYKMDPFFFLAWMGALFGLFDPLRKLAKVSTKFQQSDAAAKRIFDLMDTPGEPVVHNAPTLPRHSRSIRFENVTYHYPGVAAEVLKDVCLDVPAGKVIAIVGPNGSGKTTLLSALPRLLDPTAGRVLIDDCDISQYSLRSLRRQIGLVTQETIIFHATIAENVSYGLRRAKREDVLAAAKKAFVDEFVREMPDGYDTMVGEHGATLSGGQRQRIAIARAILRDPAILIFDEATSQVDSESEARIQEAMSGFMKERTTLLIAHRFATVLSADLIAVMNDGRIVDTGKHEDLLKRCRLYHDLYKRQFLGGTE